eukprot:CAMPEP_0185835118 /NCGR_PEP_ID=MMETSP1353-20130828/7094_1 /TAXON_ID=1077150 /ORGANISM="Erythrolobus australicus, Strain CCMP3124" /LENGTH=32 /DNA_ID= /DNA_START= /DNA_END= /DNA_ORIENTATION=
MSSGGSGAGGAGGDSGSAHDVLYDDAAFELFA